MKKLSVSFIIVMLLSLQGYCGVGVVEIQSKGVAGTRESAVKQALYQAVAQVNGIEVGSADYNLLFQTSLADVDDQIDGKELSLSSVSVASSGTTLKTRAGGYVKSYEVLDEKILVDNTYEILIKACVYKYDTPAEAKRTKIAIMPIRMLASNYRIGNYTTSGNAVAEQLNQKINVNLAKTNKFAVLDREYTREYISNQNILKSVDASFAEKAKIGNALGADFILVGTISDLRFETKTKYIEAIGRTAYEYQAFYKFDYRFINAQTMQVMVADTADIFLEKDGIKKLVRKWRPDDLDFKEILDSLNTIIAKEITEEIIGAMYPIRIASVEENGQIIINQGKGRISVGSIFEVILQGKEIVDGDTGEILGNSEMQIAQIEITKVMPKFAYAKVIGTGLAKISKDMVCRQQKNIEIEKLLGRKNKLEKTPQGGIRLPFDK